MPLYSARKIAEEALRKIGVFSINDSEAQQNHLEIANEWLGVILDEAGAIGLPFLREKTFDIAFVEGETSYSLADATISGVIFPLNAWLIHTSLGTVRQIDLLTREDWDRCITGKALIDGEPQNIFVDQVGLRTLHIDRIPTEDVAQTYQIRIRAQTYSETSTTAENGTLMALPPMWNMWAIYALASHLGNGTIRRLPDNILGEFRGHAASKFEALNNAMRRNRTNRPPVATPHWM
jgi:hypothetical protein